jgi:hypothetical protein
MSLTFAHRILRELDTLERGIIQRRLKLKDERIADLYEKVTNSKHNGAIPLFKALSAKFDSKKYYNRSKIEKIVKKNISNKPFAKAVVEQILNG